MTTKPAILTVDDDPEVLRAIGRDLRQRYGEHYRIIRAESGAAALDALRELQTRHESVALFVIDQRMPAMTGVEFLEQAMRLYPDARRVLLTAYADTDAAIRAINRAAVHYYLLKPWDPPQDSLYPVLDDLLDDWRAGYRPPFQGIRVIAHRWSPQAHQVKDFLARNQIPYQYLDLEADSEARELRESTGADAPLPLVIYEDGAVAHNPSTGEIAEKVGLRRQAGGQFYDLVIVGGGPAGLAAAVYGASEGLRTMLIEREATGGQAGTSSRIENYLGFPSGLSGADLARRATTQAQRFGVEILAPQEATSLRVDGPYRFVKLADDSEIACHALIIAVGLSYSRLDVPGADRLSGAGIYYGSSITEAFSCRDQTVFIVGAGNSAGQAALYLAGFASQVTMLVRGDSLEAKMSQYLVERIVTTPNIEVCLKTMVAAVEGEDHVESVTVRHLDSGYEETRPAEALFVFIGAYPQTGWLDGVVRRDGRGFIPTGPDLAEDGSRPRSWPLDRDPYLLESSVPGVFVVGDVRANSVKRVASAVGEGSIAVQFVHQHLSRLR